MSLSMSMWIASPFTYKLFSKYFSVSSEINVNFKNDVHQDPCVIFVSTFTFGRLFFKWYNRGLLQ